MNALELALMRLEETVRESSEEAAEESIDEALALAADLNVEQLMRGENAKGDRIEPGYASDEYAAIKNAVNPLAGRYTPDLKAEGDFHESIHAKQKGRDIVMDASDWKKNELVEKYGPILGLQPESLARLIEEQLEPAVKQAIKQEFTKQWNNITK